MIVFDLQCDQGHVFEGWFDDGRELDRQQEQGLVSCPVCESTAVTRKLSAVAVRTSSSASAHEAARHEALMELGARINDFVEKNFENVGSDFAKESLKMHYGAADPRNIRGTTTKEEDKMLSDEGIPVVKLPFFPPSDEELN